MIVETIACLQLLGREPLIMPGAVVRSPTPPLWVLVPSGSVSISHGRSPPSVCVWIDEREGNCAAFPIKALYKCKCIYHLEFPDAQSKVSADVVSPSSLWRNQRTGQCGAATSTPSKVAEIHWNADCVRGLIAQHQEFNPPQTSCVWIGEIPFSRARGC